MMNSSLYIYIFLPFTTLAVLSAILKWSKVISSRQLVHQNILRVAQW